jgi:hypothetical protein
MATIKRIVLSNFKRFPELDLVFDDDQNVLIGDNESGKSSVLLALDLVLSGSRSRVQSLGLETLLNSKVVSDFLDGNRSFADLPRLFVEIYLSEMNDPNLNGRNNSRRELCDGLRFECEPIQEYGSDIVEALQAQARCFPFEFYAIRFTTFADQVYSGIKKPIKHVAIDSSQINTEYATREYTRSVFTAKASVPERQRAEHEYRQSK